MAQIYSDHASTKIRPIICNEGGSRSGKSYDTAELLYTFCTHNSGLEMYVIRRTLKNARELAYKDFKECLQGAGVFDNNCAYSENSSPRYCYNGNFINFIGLDNNTEPKRSDIIYINEALEIENETLINGWKRRCEMFMICDWNPKFSKHWIFDWEKQPNVYFTHTTYRDNKHLRESIRVDIESKSPWHLDDLHLPVKERRPHIDNISNGTVNEYEFLVYGMGIRASLEGQIFKDVTWIDDLPDAKYYNYGLDFGYTHDPTCLVKVCIIGRNLYAKKMIYQPTPSSYDLIKLLEGLKISKRDIIIADSSDTGANNRDSFVTDLQIAGYSALKVKKGAIMDGITRINNYNIHLVKDKDVEMEQQNYLYKVVCGYSVNQPIDAFNHFWDMIK